MDIVPGAKRLLLSPVFRDRMTAGMEIFPIPESPRFYRADQAKTALAELADKNAVGYRANAG